MFKDIFSNKTVKNVLIYGSSFVVIIILLVAFARGTKINDFLTSMENSTFDLRQRILVDSYYKKDAKGNFLENTKVNKDIVIITIDDASFEYLGRKFGEWPAPRDIYADLINYIEKQHPKSIAFDFMFVQSLKSKNNADMALTKAITGYDNVFVSMNLDGMPERVRPAINLPDHLSVKVKNDSPIDYTSSLSELRYANCRAILPQIIKGTSNIGMINVTRSDDGILREIPPFTVYKEHFYPALALLVGLKDLNYPERDFNISKNLNLKIDDKNIPIYKDGGIILNWYGEFYKSFKLIPFYEVYQAMEGISNEKFDFKNKIVYVGPTALALYDLKSVPVDRVYMGVGLHATFINNLIDNSFIKRVPPYVDILISIILAAIVGIVIMRTASTSVALTTAILTSAGYIIFSYYIMKFFNIWIGIILPITFIILVFVLAYIVKYLLKSRDFEHQYKLATTDGLTELYNHRYFQEQMIMQAANCKRYNSNFSLILIDIDFFKKFNDVYGHQSGDAVLRQVALKLKKNVRSTDIVCRYGGEEMTIILPNTDRDEAIITAQKICQVVAEKPFKLANDQESNVTISLGVATFPQDGETPGEITAAADKRLYVAKENGRNQVGY